MPFAELVSQGAEPGALRAWVQLLKVARQDSDRITSAMAAVPPEQRVVSLAQWEREGKVQATVASTASRSSGSQGLTVTPCSSRAFTSTICTVSPTTQATTLAASTVRRRVTPVGPRKHFPAAPTSVCQRAEREATARSRWTAELAEMLANTDTPASTQTDQPLVSQVGAGRRASTLHQRVCVLRHFKKWLQKEHNLNFPTSQAHVVGFLRTRAEQGASRSTLKSIKAALSFFELAAGVETQNQLTKKRIFRNAFAETMTSAKASKPPRQAPRPFIIMLSALEDAVFDVQIPPFYRAFAWWHLVQCWGVLRHSDHLGFHPLDTALFDITRGCLRATLTRTKTTGDDKQVRYRPLFISSSAWVKHQTWLPAGWKILQELAPLPRDYLLPSPADSGFSIRYREMSHSDALAADTLLLSTLRDPFHRNDIPGGFLLLRKVAVNFFTEHSYRSFLPTAAGCMGFLGKDGSNLDLVGCWKATGGQAYVRAHRHRALIVQRSLRRLIENGTACHTIDEEESVFELKRWLLAQGLPEVQVDAQCRALHLSATFIPVSAGPGVVLKTEPPALMEPPAKGSKASRRLEALKSLKPGFYLAHLRYRKGSGTLHQLHSCFRVPGVDYVDYTFMGAIKPALSKNDAVCSYCSKHIV